MSFPARYSGWCGRCSGSFTKDDLIRRITPITRKVPTKTERYQPASEFEMRPKILKYRHEKCP